MTKHAQGAAIDTRIIPDIISFKYPKSRWVRLLLVMEMTCAILAVIGTLILTLLPKTSTNPPGTNAATTEK